VRVIPPTLNGSVINCPSQCVFNRFLLKRLRWRNHLMGSGTIIFFHSFIAYIYMNACVWFACRFINFYLFFYYFYFCTILLTPCENDDWNSLLQSIGFTYSRTTAAQYIIYTPRLSRANLRPPRSPPTSPSPLYTYLSDPRTERAYIIAADKNNHNQNFQRVNCCGFWLEWQWGRISYEKRIISLISILTCHRRTVVGNTAGEKNTNIAYPSWVNC